MIVQDVGSGCSYLMGMTKYVMRQFVSWTSHIVVEGFGYPRNYFKGTMGVTMRWADDYVNPSCEGEDGRVIAMHSHSRYFGRSGVWHFSISADGLWPPSFL